MFTNLLKATGLWMGLFAGSYLVLKTVISEPDNSSVHIVLANRVCSMTHALGTLYLATNIVLNGPTWNIYNTPEQTGLIVFSCSYYLTDTLYVSLIEPSRLFLAHHGAMISYWLSALYLNQGGYVGALVIIPGEITNPIQIVWSLSKKYRIESLYAKLSPFFTYFFIFVRSLCLPIISPMIWMKIWRQQIPSKKWKLFWISLGLGMTVASGIWSRALWLGYLKQISRQVL